MKIALLLAGQPRFLHHAKSGKGFRSLIMDRYDTDIYGHAWKSSTFKTSTWTKIRYGNNADTVEGNDNPEEKLKELYPGITLQVESSRTFGYPDTDRDNMASHLYSIEQTGKMVASPEEYDFIIQSRWDCNLITLDNLEGLSRGWYVMNDRSHGIADQLFIFSPEYIEWLNLYCNYNGETCAEVIKQDHFYKTFPGQQLKRFNFSLDLLYRH